MRILQLTPGYAPVIGGVERHVQALSERLAATGHEVTVATMQPAGQHLLDETLAGVVVRRFSAVGPGEAYRAPLGLPGFLRGSRNQWDVVHVHNYHAALIPLAALAGVQPLVVTTHLNDTPHSGAAALLHVPYTAIGRWALRKAQAVICVTEAERERVRQRLGVSLDRSIVIPNGVGKGALAARQHVGERDPYLLLSVGRLQAYKRVEDAIAIVSKLEPRYRLVIVGDGPHRSHLEQRVAQLGLGDRVQFAGRASDEDLVDWYARAGVVLSLSEAEAFGMTVLEGVAAGCQVVCSDIPAFRDLAGIFPDHVTVVRRRNETAGGAAVRNAVQRLPGTPADVTAFTWDAVTERVLEVYRRVTGAARTLADADGLQMAKPDGDHLLAEG